MKQRREGDENCNCAGKLPNFKKISKDTILIWVFYIVEIEIFLFSLEPKLPLHLFDKLSLY